MKSWLAMVSLMLLVALTSIVLVGFYHGVRNTKTSEGEPLPILKMKSPSGEIVSSEVFKGRKCVFLFFDAGCPPCRRYLRVMEDVAPILRERGIRLVLAALGSVAATEELLYGSNLHSDLLFVPVDAAMHTFGITRVPVIFLVDDDRRLVRRLTVDIPLHAQVDAIQAFIKE
jgi:peroxiredoxin